MPCSDAHVGLADPLQLTAKSTLARHRWLTISNALVALSIVGAVYVGVQLVWYPSYIMGDTYLYFLIGRGILNGLTPYADLFESKPPGMFLLSAISLLLGGTWFLKTLYVAAILTIALFSVQIPFLAVLALIAHAGAYGAQPEVFGAVFGLFYIWSVRRGNQILAVAMLLLAVGTKEPFLPALFGAFLLTKKPVRIFAGHLFVAGAIGAGLLTASGWLHPYLTLYLPVMFGERVAGDPLLLKMLHIKQLTEIFGSTGWILLTALACRRKWNILGMILLHLLLVSERLYGIVGAANNVFILFSAAVGAGIGVYIWRAKLSPGTFRDLAGLCLVLLAATLAPSVPIHHALVIIPFAYAAFASLDRRIVLFLSATALLLFRGDFNLAPAPSYYPTLDIVMDACGYDRYFSTDKWGFFNRHSPIGPVSIAAIASLVGPEHPLVQETLRQRKKADLIIGDTWFFDLPIDHTGYTNMKPACAPRWDKSFWIPEDCQRSDCQDSE